MTDFFVDPHAALAEARAAGPVLDDGIGGVVLRYEDVRATLADPARFREAFIDALRLGGVTSGAFHDWMAISPLDRDGDEHKAWRAVMARTFTPRQVEAMRPAIAARCQELIDTFPMGEPFDVVAAFAQRLPLDALCALVGVPDGDRDDFRVWADTIGLGFDILGAGQRIDEIDAALEQLLAYTTELVALRTAEPADDLVSRIAEAAVSGAFTQQEAVSSVAGLVFAGHETTRNQLGTTWVLLATTAGAWDDVAAGVVEPAAAAEEILRLHGAASAVGRSATVDTEVGGVAIASGGITRMSLWSANRDHAAFPAPDRYDPAANAATPHLAFGHGPHHCLGAALARVELTEAVRAWTARLATPTVLDGVEWRPPIGLTGPAVVPTVVSPR